MAARVNWKVHSQSLDLRLRIAGRGQQRVSSAARPPHSQSRSSLAVHSAHACASCASRPAFVFGLLPRFENPFVRKLRSISAPHLDLLLLLLIALLVALGRRLLRLVCLIRSCRRGGWWPQHERRCCSKQAPPSNVLHCARCCFCNRTSNARPATTGLLVGARSGCVSNNPFLRHSSCVCSRLNPPGSSLGTLRSSTLISLASRRKTRALKSFMSSSRKPAIIDSEAQLWRQANRSQQVGGTRWAAHAPAQLEQRRQAGAHTRLQQAGLVHAFQQGASRPRDSLERPKINQNRATQLTRLQQAGLVQQLRVLLHRLGIGVRLVLQRQAVHFASAGRRSSAASGGVEATGSGSVGEPDGCRDAAGGRTSSAAGAAASMGQERKSLPGTPPCRQRSVPWQLATARRALPSCAVGP